VIYDARCEIGSGFDANAVATRLPAMPHDFGTMPLFDVRTGHGQHVMERTYDVIRALFEREAGLCWALDAQCYAIPVLTVPNIGQIPSISANELLALVLEQGSTFTYAAPQASIFDPLFKDVERLSNDLYEVVQSMAINAAAIPQAGRLSGDAVTAMRSPMQALLKSFAWPIKETLQRALEAIAKYRGEDVEIELTGMDDPADVDMEDMQAAVGSVKPEGEDDGEVAQRPEGDKSRNQSQF
jgi:hypothetical protein